MSYSEYINIYKVSRDIDFKEISMVCKLLYKPKLIDGGYWDDKKDVFEYLMEQLSNSQYKLINKESYIFHFCNHDGINDEEIYKCHKIFTKVVNALTGALISHYSDYADNERIIYDEDNNQYSINGIKNFGEDFYELKMFFEKQNLLKELDKFKDNSSIKDIRKSFTSN